MRKVSLAIFCEIFEGEMPSPAIHPIAMKEKHDDDALGKVLREWQPRPLPSAPIRAAVWSSIARERNRGNADWINRLAGWFERPAVAAAVVVLSLALGAVAGLAGAFHAQKAAYLESMIAFLS